MTEEKHAVVVPNAHANESQMPVDVEPEKATRGQEPELERDDDACEPDEDEYRDERRYEDDDTR